MPRRKQHCPKRMKWEGGEGGEEGGSGSPGSKDASSMSGEDASPAPSPDPASPADHDARELADSRCPSRESRGSSVPPRCPSHESQCSDTTSRAHPVSPGLIPAPIAAYLGHPHHRLLSPLVTASSPPAVQPLPALVDGLPADITTTAAAVLDFSTKRNSVSSVKTEPEGEAVLNLSKPPTPVPTSDLQSNSPLDLSVSSRKRSHDDSSSLSTSLSSLSPSPHPPSRKNSRMAPDFKTVVSPWTSPVVAPHFPYFAAAVAAASSLSPKPNSNSSTPDPAMWNGKIKLGEKTPPFGVPTPSDATKALEKMSELSKLGGDDLFRPGGGGPMVGPNSGSRHSAWQSHWLNKGADQAKDVLKCVWCKQSFPSLAAMTAHMKEAKHCGVNVPAPPIQPPPPPPPQPPTTSSTSVNSSGSPASSLSGGKPSPADLNLLIKETMPLPRKLVRGQDVWLGKGAEQTRQILKCMWCGQSFRSLAEMTNHMQQTQHYTNIISQEQIISWKSSDDNKSGGGPGGGASPGAAGAASSHVSAVLTCKVCDQAFSSLKELSNHMVKNSHYKEHIMRSITESGGRRRQTREKRKKSLPVRKLLELERAQHELKNGEGGLLVSGKLSRDPSVAGRITCEKCGDKIETALFVDHIRQCVGGGSIGSNQRNLLKSALLSSNVLPGENPGLVGSIPERDGRKSIGDDHTPTRQHRSPSLATDLSTPSKDSAGNNATGESPSSSVLNAIEKLIEKSFDSRGRHGAAGGFGGGPGGIGAAPMGSSILKRLGIDESVDYTKPLVDAQTMNLLRNYHQHQHGHHFGRRERSGSESSSVSDRGSGRQDTLTPSGTPEKRIQTPPSVPKTESLEDEVVVKKETESEDECNKKENGSEEPINSVVVKKEEPGDDADEEEFDRSSFHSNGTTRTRRADDVPLTPTSAAADEEDVGSTGAASPPIEAAVSSPCRSSPASSERSATPHKKNSLGALSSMFDSLSGGGGGEPSTPTGSGGGGSGASGGSRTSSSHPLAALQKLCDKTERHGGSRGANHSTPPSVQAGGGSASTTTPGAILAFSWACNEAVMTADSIMKCAFCDTPFISKGAYRHHLSKMHFVKDGVIPDPVALKAQQQAAASGSTPGTPKGAATPVPATNNTATASGAKSPTHPANFEESPHSKFLKYTELAKQLSSKYV